MTTTIDRARRWGRRGLAGIGALAVASAPAVAAGERAAPAANPAPAAALAAPLALPSPDLPGLTPMSQALAQVELASAELSDATAAYNASLEQHSAARDARAGLDRTISAQGAAASSLQAQLAAARGRASAAAARRAEIDAAVQDLAVALYIDGGEARFDAAVVDPQPSVSDTERKQVLATASLETLLAERALFKQREIQATEEAAALDEQLGQARHAARGAADSRPAAVAAEVERDAELTEARSGYEAARVLADVDGSDFPLVALDAYWKAALQLQEDQPACALQWWGVAGISRVEGHHGFYGASELDRDGNTTKPIIGIQLNGTRETRVIGDTDGGALDGDPAFDRAVGPMQFIPSTWARWGADGNEDLTTSPHNLYDATLAAGKYLCHGRTGLDQDPGLQAGYFSYNHSLAYVANVLGHARRYQQTVEIPPVEGVAAAPAGASR